MALIILLSASGVFAALKVEKQDQNLETTRRSSVSSDVPRVKTHGKDGKIDTWITRDAEGRVVSVAYDRHVDGKPDYWAYFEKDGAIDKREWDRNFDGKPDFRTLEDHHRLLEKQYDDNFDGKFEIVQKAPAKGSSGRTKTTAGP